ncbi:MAG TPA: CinA family protein, partial [Chryseosolibacter sp.]
GFGDEPLEVAIGNALRKKKLTISFAESCTGGYLSHLITTVPGSSDYFAGSVIAYSNEIKIKDLGVSRDTLSAHGAVSEATIKEMAERVRSKFKTDIGVATSGIAGPDGGTPEKPVGTVWIAYSDNNQTVARKLNLSKDRNVNIKVASVQALNLIRTVIFPRCN